MAVSLGTGYVNVLPNLAGFRLRLSSGLKSALDEVDKIAASSSNNMSKSMGRLSIAGQAAFAGLGIAAGKFAISSIGAASDLNESLNKSVVVFGEASKAVIEFADNAAKIGLSKGAALDAAANFGAMAQAAGVATDASAKMSIKLVGLAGDLASFNNVDPSVALEKLQAGLAGEARPLREFGVFVSEARVKTEAYRSGIAEVGTELTDAQKIQARYNIILKDTTKQQGDFARTVGESLPNQLRVAKAEFENLSASVGTALLPVATATLKVMTGVIDVFTKLPAPLKTGAVLTVALGGAMVGLGLALKIVRSSLGELGIGAGRAAVAETGLTAATTELAVAETAAGTATAGFAAKLGLISKFLGPLVVGYAVFKTVTDAAGDSSKHAQQQLEGLTTAVKENRINQDLLNDAITRYPALAFQPDIRRVQTAIEDAGGAVQGLTAEEFRVRAAGRDMASGMTSALGPVDSLASHIRFLKDVHLDAAQAARTEMLAEDALAGGMLGLVSSALQARQASEHLVATRKDLNKITKAGNLETKEGREAVDAYVQAQLDAAGATLSLTDEVNTLKDSVRDGDVTMAEAKDRIRAIGAQAGLTKFETQSLINRVQGLINTYSAVPPKVETHLKELGGGEVLDTIHQIRAGLDFLGHTTTTITLRSSGGPLKNALGFEGVVTSPTLLMAGDDGPEQVTITPRSGMHAHGNHQTLVPSTGGGGDTLADLKQLVRQMMGHTHPVEMDGYRVGRAQRMRALRESGR